MIAKLPHPPPADELRGRLDPALTTFDTKTVVWRIHTTTGAHVTPWNDVRRFGPVLSCRWEPHPMPPQVYPDYGVSYLALDVPTALAETFQQHRRILNTGRRNPYLTGFRFTRPLRLLDLTGMWPLAAGASHGINAGRKDFTRAWARAFVQAWPNLDGLRSVSSMTGRTCVTVFAPAVDAFPRSPDFSEPLNHPALVDAIASAAIEIGYEIVVST